MPTLKLPYPAEFRRQMVGPVRAGCFNPEDLAIHTVKRDGSNSKFTRIHVERDENGHDEVSDPWQTYL